MTNTKFRKRALLSSVAMLLVALVALGSATFAWFVANPTATASGLVMKTEAAPGLVIAADKVKQIFTTAGNEVGAFKGTTVLNADPATDTTTSQTTHDYTLQPAAPFLTLDSGVLNFGSAPAAYSNDEDLAQNASWSPESAVYSEKIFVKTSTTDKGTINVAAVGVQINLNDTTNTAKNAIKVAVVAHQGQVGTSGEDGYVAASDTLVGIWKCTGGEDTATWNGETGTSGALVTSPAYSYKANEASAPLNMTATTSTSNNYVTVYVYLDGEGEGVFSDNVPSLTQLVDSINVKFTTTGTVSF